MSKLFENITGKLTFAQITHALVQDQLLDIEKLEHARKLVDANKLAHIKHPISQLAKIKVENKKNPLEVLDEQFLIQWLAKESGLECFTIDPLKIEVSKCTSVMSFEYATRHVLLPVKVTDEEIVIACADPFDETWQDSIHQVNRKVVTSVMASPADILRYSTEFYTLATSMYGAANKNKSSQGQNFEQLLELGKSGSADANDEHVVKIVDWLLEYAFEQRASDIHIEPRRENHNIRFRIDGVLHAVYQMPVQVGMAVTSRLKILGRMNVAEKRKPQDGRVKTKFKQGLEVELRLATMPTAFGEKMVMRIFDPEVLVRSYEQLGLSDEDLTLWNKMTSQSNGIVFVTGPTGSGKTTTLYSTLKQLATDEVNVCTLEDPIEMIEPAFNQMQVQHNIELDFATGIKALLRQDPDIIMLGEIRDLETAHMAIQAALTGHLVISTLHTNDAPSAITRLQDLGVPAYLIRSTLIGVMAQRLVRTLCSHCKQEIQINEDQWKEMIRPWKVSVPKVIYDAVGCIHCRNTGYSGRAGLYEVFSLSDPLAHLITEESNIQLFTAQAMKEGMKSLRLSGALKIAKGETTVEEVLRVAPISTRL
ncbi:GspE/PulE family protein [Marinicellulosiphila megalodicopiae]|uniref:GspE/PulE family protein n=1 Tax=Marinicellulosiphila megalodicopiae TaxID=2724896 RepID=UPI003BB21BA7